ncbi:TlyA family rRNA (cytidine-2'-O)-methyltransferase [Cellulomonas chitinilytica]|uniref:TlyA family rRNA (Cytidine-2'-O)-methyltransferase n=1 Tax=Cellulomonas chitinilytica TaxID=398759 RepID=A0A919U1X5_9CELL|nr:TlyA family RNA methyltransferase [Cellulomonas chitinilytica]GIG20917.1 TlyA family rRNA (cytidine-2'-O)-methyltransferase [Cellulomonas chitinilytica]
MTTRLDSELVHRGLARSRRQAGELIAAGRVSVDGSPARRSAVQVSAEHELLVAVDASDPGFASRAGHKLAGALDALGDAGPGVRGRVCLDAGASTGGFTDVLLRRGAGRVVAVDVGHGQLLPELAADARVESREGVNVRDLVRGAVDPAPGLVVADLSFISLTLVLPALVDVAAPGADLLVMVKPQFEVGRERLGSGGVVRDPALRAGAVVHVARAARGLGMDVRAVLPSVLPGPSGNVEYFLWLRGDDRREPGARGEDAPAGSDRSGDAWLTAVEAAVTSVVVDGAHVAVPVVAGATGHDVGASDPERQGGDA